MSNSKWTVHKRDGSWQAHDPLGKPLYASSSWDSAVMYALMGAERTISEDYEKRMKAIQGIVRSLFGNGE